MAQADASVKVAVRVRPYINDDYGYYAKQRGKGKAPDCIIQMDKDLQKTTVLDPVTKEISKEFTFDYSYNSFVGKDAWDHASNETVWLDLGLEALANAWDGYNVSIFAYGQTGSGKTYRRVWCLFPRLPASPPTHTHTFLQARRVSDKARH